MGQHDTPAMQWRQVLLEAQSLLYRIKCVEIDIEKAKIEIDSLTEKGDKLSLLDAERKRLDLAVNARDLAAARIEMNTISKIAEEIGYFSPEEIEADQETYWSLRLRRQADADAIGATQGVSAGNILAMIQSGLLEWKVEPCAISPGT